MHSFLHVIKSDGCVEKTEERAHGTVLSKSILSACNVTGSELRCCLDKVHEHFQHHCELVRADDVDRVLKSGQKLQQVTAGS